MQRSCTGNTRMKWIHIEVAHQYRAGNAGIAFCLLDIPCQCCCCQDLIGFVIVYAAWKMNHRKQYFRNAVETETANSQATGEIVKLID